MKGRHVYGRWFLALIVVLCLASGVAAVGITIPFVYKWEFSPGMGQKVDYTVINSYDFPITVAIQLGGTLRQYGTATVTSIDLPARGSGSFSVTLKLPQGLPAGEHRLEITALEQPQSGKTLSASTAVSVYLQVSVPYEGKFLRAKLEMPAVEENGSIVADVTVDNLGTEAVNDVAASITLFDKDVEVGALQTNHAPIPARGSTKVSGSTPNTLKPGVYRAEALVRGDENTTTAGTTFVVGTRDVRLISITKDLIAGQINPVSFTLLNRWNLPFDNVRATVFAGNDPRGSWKATGPEFSLQPWQPFGNEFFMKVPETVPPGTYPGLVDVMFLGQTKTFETQFTVRSAPTVEAPATNPTLLVSRIALFLLIIVTIMIYLRMRRREHRG